MQAFNINDRVRVKLTPEGKAAHAADHAAFWAKVGKAMPYKPPKEDAEGYSTWQLWSLMQAFGSHIGLGLKVPFDTEILLVKEQSPLTQNDPKEEHF